MHSRAQAAQEANKLRPVDFNRESQLHGQGGQPQKLDDWYLYWSSIDIYIGILLVSM